MLSAFGGVLLPYFMKPVPNVVIDSWADLYHRPGIKVLALEMSFINSYITEFKDKGDPMALVFSEKFIAGDNWLYEMIGDVAKFTKV